MSSSLCISANSLMKREFYKTKRDVTDASVRVKANLNQNIVNDKKHINIIVSLPTAGVSVYHSVVVLKQTISSYPVFPSALLVNFLGTCYVSFKIFNRRSVLKQTYKSILCQCMVSILNKIFFISQEIVVCVQLPELSIYHIEILI